MGKRGRAPKRSGMTTGGWVVSPPISRGDASEALGMEIDRDAWAEVEAAFEAYGIAVDECALPTVSSKEAAVKKTDTIRYFSKRPNSRTGESNAENVVTEIFNKLYELKTSKGAQQIDNILGLRGVDYGLVRRLELITGELKNVLWILAEFREMYDPKSDIFGEKSPSVTDAQNKLIRDLSSILARAQLPHKPVDGRSQVDGEFVSGPFEMLVLALGIFPQGMDIEAESLARRIRYALASGM